MIEDVHIEDDLPIPAASGWAEMHLLLNKEMPVTKTRRRFLLFSLIPIAAMLIIFLAVSIRLNQEYYQVKFYQQSGNNQTAVKHTGKIEPVSIQNNKKDYAPQKKRISIYSKVKANDDFPYGNFDISVSSLPGKIIVSPEIHKVDVKQTASIKPIKSENSKTTTPLKKWGIYAGAAINMATTGNQNFQPYPAVTVRYNVSSRLFISSGLSLLSPAPGRVSGISKIVHVNDVVNNTSQVNDVTSYDKLLYADLPITLGIQLNKNMAVQAGLQSSLLVSKRKSVEKVAYDFQMNRIESSMVSTAYAPPPPSEQTFDVKLPSMDYRLLSGISYQIKKASIGVYYQHSLRNTTIPKNNVVSLQVLWQLK